MPKEITAYQTNDGKTFSSEQSAIEHEDDLIGCELDSLFDLFGLKSGNHSIGHCAFYHAYLNAIKSKDDLRNICNKIVQIVDNN